MKALANYWFTTRTGTIGVVVGQDDFTAECKGYIGVVDGHNQQADIQAILDYGTPVSVPVLEEIIQALMPKARRMYGRHNTGNH
jgi:hypothetical protein